MANQAPGAIWIITSRTEFYYILAILYINSFDPRASSPFTGRFCITELQTHGFDGPCPVWYTWSTGGERKRVRDIRMTGGRGDYG